MILDIKDKLYTSTEVASILGVSLRSVYRYLDEDKIQADIKTATGRHRFSKQNILDFLQPSPASVLADNAKRESNMNKDSLASATSKSTKVREVKRPEPSVNVNLLDNMEEDTDDEVIDAKSSKTDKEASNTAETTEDQPVDWLARFRAAAEKYKAEQAVKTVPDQSEAVSNIQEVPEVYASDAIVDEVEEEADVLEDEKTEYFYLSGVGSLKDIAQSLDKAAKKASVDYVFTMDAGLSLFKPIRPFSLIHAYIRSEDRPYFEKSLKLTEVNKSSAQLCLLISEDSTIYDTKKEMYGLNVVSKERLKKDLVNSGEKDLVEELDTLA